jgi:hypothetical protein
VACLGKLNKEGRYELQTGGVKVSENGPGVPPGWYKVVLVNRGDSNELDTKVNPVYLDENKTPLTVEVVENPQAGAYDFKVTK